MIEKDFGLAGKIVAGPEMIVDMDGKATTLLVLKDDDGAAWLVRLVGSRARTVRRMMRIGDFAFVSGSADPFRKTILTKLVSDATPKHLKQQNREFAP